MSATTTSGSEVEGCLLIETLGASAHTLVFDTDRAKGFASVARRQHHRGDRVSTAIAQTVTAVRGSARNVYRTVALRDGSAVHVRGTPVFGPTDQVFAVEIVTSSDDLATAEAMPRRTVGGFAWDPERHMSLHSEALESAIFGVIDGAQAHRSSAEIFRHIDEFARMAAIGDFVADLRTGGPGASDTFDGDLLMTGADGRQRRVQISCRAVQRADGRWAMHGLVHDITDIAPPAPASGYGAGAVRSVLRMVSPGANAGIGHLNFPTLVVTEWFTAPPTSLQRWTTENAEIHPEDRTRLADEVASLSDGAIDHVVLTCRVRFSDSTWETVEFEVRPMSRGRTGQGLVKVTTPPATHCESVVPETMASIDQRSGPLAET